MCQLYPISCAHLPTFHATHNLYFCQMWSRDIWGLTLYRCYNSLLWRWRFSGRSVICSQTSQPSLQSVRRRTCYRYSMPKLFKLMINYSAGKDIKKWTSRNHCADKFWTNKNVDFLYSFETWSMQHWGLVLLRYYVWLLVSGGHVSYNLTMCAEYSSALVFSWTFLSNFLYYTTHA